MSVMALIEAFFLSGFAARAVGLAVWIGLSFLLMPAVVRCLRRRPCYSDPLFFAGFLLTLNRIAFGIQNFAQRDALAAFCRWTGIVIAVGYGVVAWHYMRSERGR